MESLTPNETRALLWFIGILLSVCGLIVIGLFKAIYNYIKKMSENIEEQNKLAIDNKHEIEKSKIRHDFLEHRVTSIEKRDELR